MTRVSRGKDDFGLDAALARYPGLAIRPSRGGRLIVAGELEFRASTAAHGVEIGRFDVEITLPAGFPRELPTLRETDGVIPADFHVHPDGTRCLGAPTTVRGVARANPTLLAVIERLVVPYLYGYTVYSKRGVMPFGELAHGARGLLDAHRAYFGVSDDAVCLALLNLVATKRRTANKRVCPCGSDLRVGRCHHRSINRLRILAARSEFAAEAAYIRRRLPVEEEVSGEARALRIVRAVNQVAPAVAVQSVGSCEQDPTFRTAADGTPRSAGHQAMGNLNEEPRAPQTPPHQQTATSGSAF